MCKAERIILLLLIQPNTVALIPNLSASPAPPHRLLFIRLLTIHTHLHTLLIQRVLLPEIHNIESDLAGLIDLDPEEKPLGEAPGIDVVVDEQVVFGGGEAAGQAQVPRFEARVETQAGGGRLGEEE